MSGALPAVGVSETQRLELKTVGALIKLEILDSDITSILIQSTGGTALAGKLRRIAEIIVLGK